MGLLRSICVLHVKSKRRRRYNAVMHPRSSCTLSSKLASQYVGLVQKQLAFIVTVYLFRRFIGVIIPAAHSSLDTFAFSLPSVIFYIFYRNFVYLRVKVKFHNYLLFTITKPTNIK